MEMEERIKKQLEFVMRTGAQMKLFMNEQLIKEFETHEERSSAFLSLIINFVANTVNDISQPEYFTENMNDIINGLKDWLEGNAQQVVMKYNVQTKKVIKKEGLH